MDINEKNPNPTKDQHFMVDQDMLQLIYDSAEIKPGEHIIEIGGGAGALTDYLVQGDNHITVIEKDPYYAELLKNKYKDMDNVEVIEGDALDFNYSGYDRIVANLPYTITEPLLINLARTGALEHDPSNKNSSCVKSVTLVLSQNSTRKIVAPVQISEGSSKHVNKEFGIMGAISKAFCDTDIITAIPSEAFFPEPAVTSFLVNLKPRKAQTTVDRILREMLIDKKGYAPSVKRVYQLMLSQNKIYKPTKHKNNMSIMSSSNNFTSKNIEDKNIYDLTNTQVSQLVQDLIRNDIKIKSSKSSSYEETPRYMHNGRYSLDIEDYYDDDDYDDDEYYDEEYEYNQRIKVKTKFEEKYDYMYESKQYGVLLNRGLEYIDPIKLQEMLGKKQEKQRVRTR